jgi:ABC-type oligopeptide transport system ATPase subunit
VSMLELDKVSKVFKSGTFGGSLKPALRQVSFAIDRGEVVSLIGESGSGKSTLGKIVLHLTPASAGKVSFEGQDVTEKKGRELHEYYRYVQGVFQDPFSSYNPLYKADRVFEMVRQEYFGGLQRDAWEAKVETVLETVTLNPADVLNKFPHQLSGGQQQRLLVARALLLDVKLLIADEIISMLDASTRVDVLNMLVSLKRRGLGILFITHDLSLGNYISDKTVILRHGAVVEMGETPKVFGNPQHRYTKSLLTAVPQLHKKWAPFDWSANGSAAPASSGTLRSASGASAAVAEEARETRRYSRSSLSPLHAAKGEKSTRSVGPGAAVAEGAAPGPRPSLMEMEGGRWHRRARRRVTLAEVLAESAPPPLVECEPGHLVAVEG